MTLRDSVLWQEAIVQHLTTLLRPHPSAQSLLLVGSTASDSTDNWSDLDAILVVADGKLDAWFPATSWLEPLGPLFAFEQHPGQNRGTTRLCFTNGRRLDLIIVTESNFLSSSDLPLRDGVRVVFSRSEAVRTRAARGQSRPPVNPLNNEQFDTFVNQFWFRAVVATEKVVRNDLLIGLHLCLEAIQDTCVLAMMLRDREEGTTVHRTGGVGNLFAQQLYAPPASPTARGILASLEQTGRTFDSLAAQWTPLYEARRGQFSTWLEKARKECVDS